MCCFVFFFQAEDGIRDAQESRGLGDVYKRQFADTLRDETPDQEEVLSSLEEQEGLRAWAYDALKLSLIHI